MFSSNLASILIAAAQQGWFFKWMTGLWSQKSTGDISEAPPPPPLIASNPEGNQRYT